jgi:hypothetical protein
MFGMMPPDNGSYLRRETMVTCHVDKQGGGQTLWCPIRMRDWLLKSRILSNLRELHAGRGAMQLITVAEMDDLPDDPATAFVQLERICRTRLHEYTEQQERYEYANSVRLEYMTIVASAAETYGVADLGDPESWDAQYFDSLYQRAISAATRLTIEGKRARALGSVTLPQGAKERLKKHLEDLRAAVDAADFDEKRKKVLREKLAGFEKEIGREKSNINTILVGVALVAAALKQGTGVVTGVEDSIIKLPETVNAINILLGREKLRELEAAPDPLPLPRSVTKSLPPPKPVPSPDRLGSSGGFADDLDDDVPF